MGGGGGGGAPPNVDAACAFNPLEGTAPGGGKLTCGGADTGMDVADEGAPSLGKGGGGSPSKVFCRIGGGAALLTGGWGGKLGGGGGGTAPVADEAGTSPAGEDFFESRSSKTSRSDPPLSLMMRSFS
jgi:hypothetical protein